MDPFGLPRIDQVIDSMVGYDLLCFLNCYFGYHQIAIKEEDQEKTMFITPFGAYCYTTMSFGLKMPEPPTSELSRTASRSSSIITSKPTWIPTRSSPIMKRLLHLCESTSGSSTPTSASSVYPQGNYSASLSVIAASKPTLKRSPPLPT
jgi:hypothetical protein